MRTSPLSSSRPSATSIRSTPAQATGADDFLNKPIRAAELALRVQAAVKLRRLGSELREHYALLRRQRDGLVRLQLQKEQLIAFVVHDLKNPVNSMDLQAQLLERIPELPAVLASRLRASATRRARNCGWS